MHSARLALVPILLLAACGSTRSSVPAGASEPTWIQPSPDFQRQIELHSAKLPYLQKLEDFVAEIEWFVGAGEPAYPRLLELAASEDPKVAGTALAALGGMQDARLVPHLNEIPWPPADQPRLGYERARCHLKLGDWARLEILIDGLEDENLYARSLCFQALHETTGETFDYLPRGEDAARAEAVTRWREWNVRRLQ